MKNPIICNVGDAEAHFSSHSHISTLINACKKRRGRNQALIELANAIEGAIMTADASTLRSTAQARLKKTANRAKAA